MQKQGVFENRTAKSTLEEVFVSVLVRVIVWLLVVPNEPSYKMTGDSVSGTIVTVAC